MLPGTVKIEISWCGICGTDIGEFVHGPHGIPVEQPHPLTHDVMPVVIGHELAGEVVELGDGVAGVGLGDRVVVEPLIRCGECAQCVAGRYNLCEVLAVHGLSGGGGGFAEYTVVPDYTIHCLPDSMSYQTATLVEPLAVAVRAVSRAGVAPTNRVLVFGGGPIGLMVIAALKGVGVSEVVVIEPAPARRELALALGADSVHDVNWSEHNRERPGVDPFDVVFDAAGIPAALDAAVSLTRRGGTLLCISRYKTPAQLDPNRLRAEITLASTQAYCGEFPEVIEALASGQYDVEAAVTKQIELDDIVRDGFEALLQRPVTDGKIIVRCERREAR